MSQTNADVEMLWVAAWNDLFDLTRDRWNVPCVLPDGTLVDVEGCQGWLQDAAYLGYVPSVEMGWLAGRRAVLARRKPNLALLGSAWVPPHKPERLAAELAREMSSSHVLHGCQVNALARRLDGDDVLFEVEGFGFAIVHLTWQKGGSSVWPHARLFEDWLSAVEASRREGP